MAFHRMDGFATVAAVAEPAPEVAPAGCSMAPETGASEQDTASAKASAEASRTARRTW